MEFPVGALFTRARLAGLLPLFLLAFAAAIPARAGDPTAEGTIQTLGGDLYAGGAVPGAAAQAEIRERLDAGLSVTFTYHYLFFRPRRLWFNKTVGERTVSRTVSYDPLSALWRLESRINDGAATTDWTRERADAEQFLERIDAMNLGPASMDRPTAAGVKAQMRVHLYSASVLFVPWDLETPWREVAIIPDGR